MIETLGWQKDQWLDIDKIFIAANNRGLKFADGIFETILIKENKPILFDAVSYTHLTLPTNREV